MTALATSGRGSDKYPDWSAAKTADFIYYRNAANQIVRYYYCNGKWITERGVAEAKIPAGTAFWYYGNAAGAKVVWREG